MAFPIRISIGDVELDGTLNDSDCARAVARALPVRARFVVWGDELHFPVPVRHDIEPDARRDVAAGDVGYWPEGGMLCIFFGPTPMSEGEAPRAAYRVNVVGSLQGAEALRRAKEGREIVVESVE